MLDYLSACPGASALLVDRRNRLASAADALGARCSPARGGNGEYESPPRRLCGGLSASAARMWRTG